MLKVMRDASPTRKTTSGFTLVEMLVVIVVIGVLAAIAVPIFLDQSAKADEAALKSDLANAARMLTPAYAEGATLPTQFPAGQATPVTALDNTSYGSLTPNATLRVDTSSGGLCVTGAANGTDWQTAGGTVSQGSCTLVSSSASAPGAPFNLSATAGDGQVALVWSVPQDDGGDTVTGYTVEYSTSAEGPWTEFVAGTTDTFATVTSLTNGTGYYFQVTATNRAGTGIATSATATPLAPIGVMYGEEVEGCNIGGSFYALADYGQWLADGCVASYGGTLETAVVTPDIPARSDSFQLAPTITNAVGDVSYSVTGSLPPEVTFNTTTGVFTGPEESEWIGNPAAVEAGGSGSEEPTSVAVDSEGNMYITGRFSSSTASFGSTTFTNSGGNDVFVAKLDRDGNWVWAKHVGGTGEERGEGIAVDGSGNIYVTGHFMSSTLTFGSTTLTKYGYRHAFVAKLDTNGNWLWAKQAGSTPTSGNSQANGYDITVDNTGNVFVAGYGTGDAVIGAASLSTNGVFVAKLDTNGNWQWVKQATNAGVGAIAVDGTGKVILTGNFSGTASFGATSLTSAGGADVFVAKLDSSGNWQWAKRAGSTSSDYSYDADVDASSNTYITGMFPTTASFGATNLTSAGGNDVFVAKLDANGNWQWAKRAGSTSSDSGDGVVVDSSGNPYITGYFQNTADFGNTNLTSNGQADVFVAKLDPSGNWQWAKRGGGWSSDQGEAIAIDGFDNLAVTGNCGHGAQFVQYVGVCGLGSTDVFVAVLDNTGTWGDGTYTLPGLPTTVDVTVTDSNSSATTSVTLSVG